MLHEEADSGEYKKIETVISWVNISRENLFSALAIEMQIF